MKLSSTKKAIISLYGLQISNLVFPLIIFPWLAFSLGIEQFGLYNFVFAIIAYLNLLVDYGFNLTAARDVAMNLNDIQKNSKVFWITLYVKGILCIISFVILMFLGLIFEKISSHFLLYLLASIGLISSLLSTTYYFQGLGKLETPSLANLIARFLCLPLLFLFVKKSSDIATAILISNLPGIIAALFCIYLIIRNKMVIKVNIARKSIISGFFSGFYPFLTSGFASIYSGSYPIIIGLVLNNSAVAVFAVADKIIKVFNALITPLSMAVYHKVSEFADSNYDALKRIVKSIFSLNIILGLIFVFLIYFGVFDFVINRIFSNKYSNSLYIIHILALVPLFWGIQQISYILLLSLKKEVYMTRIYGLILIVHLPLLFFVSREFKLVGVAVLMLSIEFLIMLSASTLSFRELRIRVKGYSKLN